MKKVLSLLLVLLLVACPLAGCAGGKATSLVLLYTTDTHGHIATDEETIGLDVIAALREGEENALLLDAGDFLHGTPAATLTQGEDIVSLMKQAGYFAAAVGNHDFDYGGTVLVERAVQAVAQPNSMHLLSANVATHSGPLLLDGWTTAMVGGVRVGIFGLTTPETAVQTSPSATEGLVFQDPADSAREAVAALEAEGCALVIALVHLGSDESGLANSMDLAEEVEGIDVIIDGHSHVTLDAVASNGARVVSSGEYGRHVGRLAVEIGADGSITITNILLAKADTADVQPNAALTAAIGAVNDSQAALLAEVVAATGVDLDGDKETVRTRETNLGSLSADALLWAARADVSIMNGGNIRDSIPAGEITRGQVLTVFPYSNLVVTKRVTGAQLRDILEAGLSGLPAAEGGFPQVGGMVVEYDPAAPAGERVLSLSDASGNPIPEVASLLLATNDYLAEGGDGYPHLAGLPISTQPLTVEEAFLEYLAVAGTDAYAGSAPTRLLPVSG